MKRDMFEELKESINYFNNHNQRGNTMNDNVTKYVELVQAEGKLEAIAFLTETYGDDVPAEVIEAINLALAEGETANTCEPTEEVATESAE